MKPFDDNGRELDAVFKIERTSSGALFLIIESRGGAKNGSRPPRNPDYSQGLKVLFSRLKSRDVVLKNAELYSQPALKLSASERQLQVHDAAYPIPLAEVDDLGGLQKAIVTEAARYGMRHAGARGNATKKLRFQLDWPTVSEMDVRRIEDILANADRSSKVIPADDEGRYAPLGDYLRVRTDKKEVRLNLSMINEILGGALPASAESHQFWANNHEHHQSRRRQWLDAGFEAFFEKRTASVLFKNTQYNEVWLGEENTADLNELNDRSDRGYRRLKSLSEFNTIPKPRGSIHVAQTRSAVLRFERDPNVVAWVKFMAKGRCEVCEVDAPFVDMGGAPFLEVHHLRPLAEGGPDTVDNAIAACPNCHRQLHLGRDKEDLREEVLRKVERLRDYPATN